MSKKVLITGGGGFIGSHLCDELLEHGYNVKVLDNVSEQVHGRTSTRPSYLHRDVEMIRGDVRDPEIFEKALKNVDAVYPLQRWSAWGKACIKSSTTPT